MQRIEFRAMGCQMSAAVLADDDTAAHALVEVPHWFEGWEQTLSRFRVNSELNQMNRTAGQWHDASDTLWQVVCEAVNGARASEGLVTPLMLDALEAAGYNRSFDVIQTQFATMTIGRVAVPDWRDIELDSVHKRIKSRRGARIDLGGVAKGWAADLAASRLSTHGTALVDAGGDIAIRGDVPLTVGITNPLQPDETISLLAVSDGGLATSGRDYRRWTVRGQTMHHIIDPRTGMPAQTDVLTASVIAPTTAEAEIAAKVALILGSADGLCWIEERPALAALLVLQDGTPVQSTQFEKYIWQGNAAAA